MIHRIFMVETDILGQDKFSYNKADNIYSGRQSIGAEEVTDVLLSESP